MARCKCGKETYGGRRVCDRCLDEWSKTKATFFDEAVEKYGKMCGSNLKDIQRYVKRAMAKWERTRYSHKQEGGDK